MVNQGSYDLRHDVDRLQNKVNVFENTFTDSYFIECSVPAIFYKDDTFNPESITFYSYQDTKGKITTYKGQIKISTSVDGTTYNTIKTSTDSNTTITLSDTTIKYIKCQLYDTNNQLLDTQTVPVLKDGSDGSSPISIFLGNESQLIPCDADGKVQDTISFTIPFYCYKGTKLYPCDYNVGTTNYFTQQGFTYKLDKQCSSTDNGQITITASKDSTLRGLRHSIINMDFVVDGVTVTKEFNWAKVIKGASGDDGATPTLYVKYSKYEEPLSMDELVDNERAGYDYQGMAWVYDGVEPTTLDAYKPFIKHKAENGTPAPNGYVHFAYANKDINGNIINFSTEESEGRKYIGTLYNNTYKNSKNSDEYDWVLIKGRDGVDGITPSTEDIQNIITDSKLDALTLNGNTSDSFMSSEIPITYIPRVEGDLSRNCAVIYNFGNIVIVQIFNMSGGSSNNYGQDSASSSYFHLFPNEEKYKIPESLRSSTPQYINDLNNSDGTSNGRLRLGVDGSITKLGNAGQGYNNTYGIFIYPILPRTATKVTLPSADTYTFGGTFKLLLQDTNGNNLANKPIRFTIDGTNYTYYTNSSGVASCPIYTAGSKVLTGQFLGDKTYAPSSLGATEKSTISTAILGYSYSGGSGGSTNYVLSGNTLTVKLHAGENTLPNWKVDVNGTTYTTNSEGKIFINVPSNTTYTIQALNTAGNFSNPSQKLTITVKVTSATPTTYTDTRVPLNLVASGTSGSIKGYESSSLYVSRVQVLDNNTSNSIICNHNGSGKASLRITPAPIYFNCFNLPDRGKACDVTATILVGEFGNGGTITGGSMGYPTVQILNVITGTVYGTITPDKSFSASNNEKFEQIDVTATIPSDLIYSDNLAVKIIPKQSNLQTTNSYYTSSFRINYVSITATTK